MHRTHRIKRVVLLISLLAAAFCITLPAVAGDAGQIIDSPVVVPDSLFMKMDTLKLKPAAGVAVIRYMAEQDSALIRQWLRSQGYLDAEVVAEVEEGRARWRVQAGEVWRIRHVHITPTPDTGVLIPHAGDAFISEDYEKFKAALLWMWRDAGYLKAAFRKAVVTPDLQSREVDILWEIDPGPLFYISDIHVKAAGSMPPGWQ